MTIRKLPTGKWLAEVFPEGRAGRRVRRQFMTKGAPADKLKRAFFQLMAAGHCQKVAAIPVLPL